MLEGQLPTYVREMTTSFFEQSKRQYVVHLSFTYRSHPSVPQTTVMFADIAGFTAWSTAHSPAEVFSLLETLYGSFDEIAQRRRVFKVSLRRVVSLIPTRLLVIDTHSRHSCFARWKQLVIATSQFQGYPSPKRTMQLSCHASLETACTGCGF